MDTTKFFSLFFLTLKTHFDSLNKPYFKEFFYGNMIRLLYSFWAFLCNFVFSVFGSTIGFLYRLHACKDIERNQSEPSLDSTQNRDDYDYGSCGSGNSELHDFGLKRTGFHFSFVDKINGENKSSVFQTVTSKYEFLSEKDISGFIEEQKVYSLTVHQPCLFLDNHDGLPELQTGSVGEEIAEDSAERFMVKKILEKVVEKAEMESNFTNEAEESNESLTIEEKLEEKDQETPTGFCYVEEQEETISRRTIEGPDSVAYEFVESEEVCEEFESENVKKEDKTEEEETGLFGSRNFESVAVFPNDNLIDSDDEFIELSPQMEISGVVEEEMLVMEDSEEGINHEESRKGLKSSEEYEEPSLREEESASSCEEEDSDDDDSESMFEYDEVIEQLKMELKNARTGGLPTIDEESESTKMIEELKPLKIDVKIEHKDRMIEIHKVYRSYWDKMKKLDILNSQTIHAINLLKLKDQTQSNVTKKSSNQVAKSLILQKLLSFKQRKFEAEPIQRLIRDVHKDFETVYTGHVCLSWEILHWQFRKVLELLQHDHQALRRYNQVAGDFQLFQVLLERFIENEPFQGLPRVDNYVKNRQVSHNFLQVPVIRDDGLKFNKGSYEGNGNMITTAALREIIWESIWVFWQFLRSDKPETDLGLKGPNQTQVAPQGTVDLDLLLEIKADLQKKEKRLKDILRSGSFKAKNFQKHDSSQVVLIARIELKLISRVLRMSKLTADQLIWCHRKLHRINFSSRKIHLDPSFSLFPC
ncbi:uncharacterized protein LOC110809111 [Carica papaya]|uniref:uncharacterized protein LOC110809111 n=1 Tax=Carica papaya TaxID=3649 RepID=UPI000B8CB4DE|nr:uncharacterized protein LOC110809111 [Carica papaya]